MATVLRGGVIGAGVFGAFHARQYARLPGATLAAVFDPDLSRAKALAEPLGGQGFNRMDAFLAAVDVVTIASPAVVHAEQALAAIAAGKPVYVEKPIAVSVAEAEAIGEAARAKGLVVACGHQERALFQAIGLFDVPEPPRRLEAVRHGTPSDRNLDVSTVLDLMVHDLDLALALCDGEPVSAEGEGTRVPPGSWDTAVAEVTFDDGFVAAFDVSRCARERRRTMRLVYASGEVQIDFLARSFRNTTAWPLNRDFAEAPGAKDPLAVSLQSFLAAVRGEAPAPLVGARDAARAVDLALGVEQALEQS